MPEGDSYVRAAGRVRPVLVGRTIEEVGGSAPGVRRWSQRLLGKEVKAVRTHGKRLLIDVEGEVTIVIWLGMQGRVFVIPMTTPVPGNARLVLSTSEFHTVVQAAPRITVERQRVVEHQLQSLGPDLLSRDFDLERAVERAQAVAATHTVSELVLNQRVAAGIGNEYRCEILFLEHLHPELPAADLGVEALRSLYDRAQRVMLAASKWLVRTTTGISVREDLRTWVYGRRGRPCRRCRSAIAEGWMGHPVRITYWCPSCQPPPASDVRWG
ncbi:MAG TPA: DNA-formamidopyrimidine glycosylase family protein [Acidimicrobiia bacterium]|nr:DNA-formamidopyrimidine glycosylase family protein [Acidimicrobiia bacterium]